MATLQSTVKLFGGTLSRWTHISSACKCEMTFTIYLPPAADTRKVPVIYWLSGLTCTDENFSQKSGFGRAAAARGVALVMADTSPRGVTIAGADDSYDFGSGAGFYVNATTEPRAAHYQMYYYTYVTSELPALVEDMFESKVSVKKSIFGHSMGGHGALTIFLRTPPRTSASRPILPFVIRPRSRGARMPSRVTWGASRRVWRTMRWS